MKKKLVGMVILILVAITMVSAARVNVNENIQPTSFCVDVPIWDVGGKMTLKEQYINHGYLEDGTLVWLWYHNCTSIYTVTDATGENYTVKMTSTKHTGSSMFGPIRLKYTPFIKFTAEFKMRKTDLAYCHESYTEKGFVFWLIGNMGLPLPTQFRNTWGGSYPAPNTQLPFPLVAGTNGTMANWSILGHMKASLYWRLIKIVDLDYFVDSGEQNYTCEMATITVPAGTYNAYNVSVESTYGLGHFITWSYYVPEAGWLGKQYWCQEDENGRPTWIYKCELVSSNYTPP
jgi:hypothetical protein